MRSMIVTGAARGLGASVAARLVEDGYSVVRCDVAGSDVTFDVREAGGWHRAADALQAAGEPWGLVNCAAVTIVRDLFEIEADEWDHVLGVNLRGPLHGIQVVGALLRERGGGRIVNVSSDSAFKGRGVTGAHYAASKAGLITLTRRAAAALAGSGVTVNAVAPGTIDGETVRELAGDRLAELAAEVPLQRLARPEEIAASVAWLVSDDASYVTGTTLLVDGGVSL
jgi:3-oxoacyl-[acyl-carrier protein] reductase